MTIASVPTPDAVEHLAGLPAEIHVVVWDGTGPTHEQAQGIEFFVGRYDAPPPPAHALASMPRLRVLQLLSAGVEPWLPLLPQGVQLCNGRGVHGASTAELAVAGMLASLRRLVLFEENRKAHRWDRPETEGLVGRRVLVLGAGDIGRRVAVVAEALDGDVTLVARNPRPGVRALGDLPELLPQSDVVVLALPHVPETESLVDAQFLAALPDGALVVNIARGAIVDTAALLAELRAGRLHAFLDVTDPEPLPAGHPLWDAPNLLLTPHVGGGTRGWERRAYALVREQLLRFHAGEALINRVEAGY